MKKFVVLPLFLLVFGATAVLAQTETVGPMWAFGLNIGYGLPMSDFKDKFDGTVVAGASACYMFTNKYGLELAGEWIQFPANDDYKDTLKFFGGEDASQTIIPVTVDLVANFPMASPIIPYLKGGVGMYFWDFKTDPEIKIDVAGETVSMDDDGSDFGWNLGGGIKYPLAETTSIDIGASYHYIMTEDTATQYFTVGIGVGFLF